MVSVRRESDMMTFRIHSALRASRILSAQTNASILKDEPNDEIDTYPCDEVTCYLHLYTWMCA